MTSVGWRVAGASVQGTSHQKKNVPCQDAHLYRVLPDGSLLIATADGAGTAERSQEGADLAVHHVVAALQTAIDGTTPSDDAAWHEAMHAAFTTATGAVEQHAATEGTALRTFATTLSCALICNNWVVAGQIGDGTIVGQRLDGSLVTLIKPERGEFANETHFLTAPDAAQHLSIQVCRDDVQALAVTTDGLLHLAMHLPEYDPHPAFFQPLLERMRASRDGEAFGQSLTTFLASDRVCERTDDDKTLVVAVRDVEVELPRHESLDV